MSIISKILLGAGLIFTNPVNSDLTSNFDESEQIYQESEIVENSSVSDTNTSEIVDDAEQTELQKLLEQWINGEIELDDITLQKIYAKLKPVTEEQIDKILQNYIAESEERQKVTGIVMAVLGALLSLLAISIYLKKIRDEGKKATINNETFSQSSKLIEKSIKESKDDIVEIKKIIDSNQVSNEKINQLLLKTLESMENKFSALMGVMKIVYKEGASDGKEAQKK